MRLNVGLKWLKRVGIGLALLFLIYWLAVIIATELLRHHERTLEFLSGIDSIKHWFFIGRLVIYSCCYFLCGWFMRKLRPNISDENIKITRTLLVRFFLVYEIFFGINVIAFLSH